MIVRERISTRIIMTDLDDKALASFSNMNMVASANDVAKFAAGINTLRKTRASSTYVEKQDKLVNVE